MRVSPCYWPGDRAWRPGGGNRDRVRARAATDKDTASHHISIRTPVDLLRLKKKTSIMRNKCEG